MEIYSLNEAMSKATEDGVCEAQFGCQESSELTSKP